MAAEWDPALTAIPTACLLDVWQDAVAANTGAPGFPPTVGHLLTAWQTGVRWRDWRAVNMTATPRAPGVHTGQVASIHDPILPPDHPARQSMTTALQAYTVAWGVWANAAPDDKPAAREMLDGYAHAYMRAYDACLGAIRAARAALLQESEDPSHGNS